MMNEDSSSKETAEAMQSGSESDGDSAPADCDLSEEDLPIDDSGDGQNSHSCAVQIQQRAAEFISYIKEECLTTQVTIDSVISGVDELFRLYNQFLKTKLMELSDPDVVQKQDIEELFSYLNQQTIFEGVQTAFKMEKYQKLIWKALVPRRLVLKWKKALVHGKVKEVPDKAVYFVDFLSQLENILQCQDILNCIDSPKVSSDTFRCALDGYAYQNHPIRRRHPNALAIILYLDDILPLDSLSSYQDHSVRNYSWTLANIYPELRSSVRAINLLALAKSSTAKEYRNEPMLKNFIKGINSLSSEEGVTFNIRGVSRKFYGFLLFVVGDYPALANIGGFKESASFAWWFCRQCMITRKELQSIHKESQVTLRSSAMHQQQLQAMSGTRLIEEEDQDIPWEMEEEPENLSVKYGVNFASPLLALEYFDVCQNLPQDIMHLFLEGIFESACRILLCHATAEKKLSLKEVNLFLLNHDYGKLRTDKPSPIEPQHLKNGLRQTSSQMLMLSSLLPFILKDTCDKTKLENFIHLLMIFGLCMAHEIDMSDIDILRKMIESYLIKFSELYPGKVTPKHHFLIHLPTQIVLFSVLTEQWAMRFEAFHSNLKRLAKVLHNARNLISSLMIRMCAKQAAKMNSNRDSFLSCSVVKFKVKQKILLPLVPFKDCLLSCLKSFSEDLEITELEYLKWYGPSFSKGDVFLLNQTSALTLPIFATVVQMYCMEDRYVLIYRELQTLAFCSDLNAYQVKCTEFGSFGALDITSNSNLLQAMFIKCGSSDYVLLRQNSKPQFSRLGYEL